MADLLPCPFCGSTNLRHEFYGSQGFIECNECGTSGPCDERAADPICDHDAACDAWNRRATLAQPAPPAEGEVGELVAWLRSLEDASIWFENGSPENRNITRVADLLEQRHPAPVPVSERLPGPEDCLPWPGEPDETHWCWMSRIVNGFSGRFVLWEQVSVGSACRDVYTHWLPAHALPLPAGEVQP